MGAYFLSMSTLTQYIQSLKDLEANLDSIVNTAIKNKEGFILGLLKNRLFQTGISGDGSLIGYYAPSTVKDKRERGKRAAFITLRDEGDWYRGMFVIYDGTNVLINSSDEKTSSLIQEYGKSILELTEQEQNLVIDTIIEPAILNHITKLANTISLGPESSNFFSAQ